MEAVVAAELATRRRFFDTIEKSSLTDGQVGRGPEVIAEVCFGWYRAADVAAQCGATVHLAHPLGTTGGIGGQSLATVSLLRADRPACASQSRWS